MGHLTAAQLVDLAEDNASGLSEASSSHLRSCSACRDQLEELRKTMAVVGQVEVPEPSPLFWEHFSERVRVAVADEHIGAGRGVDRWSWLGSKTLWAGAAAVAVLAIAVTVRIDRQPVSTSSSAAISLADVVEPLESPDDASLSLVADLAADLDWETASEAGFTTHVGVDNDAVTQLSDGERHELHQLLKGELGPRGPS